MSEFDIKTFSVDELVGIQIRASLLGASAENTESELKYLSLSEAAYNLAQFLLDKKK